MKARVRHHGGALEDKIAAVLAGRMGIFSAYVFGSEAEGRAHRESDVDVGVVLRYDEHPTERGRFEARQAVRNLARDARFPADLVRELDRLPGFRNVLVRDYVGLDMHRVVEALDQLAPPLIGR